MWREKSENDNSSVWDFWGEVAGVLPQACGWPELNLSTGLEDPTPRIFRAQTAVA